MERDDMKNLGFGDIQEPSQDASARTETRDRIV